MNKDHKLADWLKCYTAVFLAGLSLVVAALFYKNLTFVHSGDTLSQHYPAFLYIGQWYREAIKCLLIEHSLPAMWDFSIGYGMDISQTLAYYGMFDWSTVAFAVFSNTTNGPALYTAMILFRTFIVGTAFLLFCYENCCSKTGSMVATFVYMLCPFMLNGVFYAHHFFALPLFYLPLILMSIDLILRGRKKASLSYVVIIALSILSSYYWFYMEMVFAVLYSVVRFRYFNGNSINVKSFLTEAGKVSLYTILGIFIAMPAILPAISALFSDARLSSSVKVPLLYSWNEYREVIGNIIASNAFNFYSYIGISACILLGVFTMLTSKGDTWLKTLWIISFTSCLIPIAGYFMNGMTYVANRHSWIFTMMSCFVFAWQFEKLLNLTRREAGVLLAVTCLYIALLVATGNTYKRDHKVGIVLLLISSLSLFTYAYVGKQNIKQKPIMSLFLITMVAAGSATHFYSVFVGRLGNITFFTPEETKNVYSLEYEDAYSSVQEDKTYWRMDWRESCRRANTINNVQKEGSTYSYWSFQNGYLVQYLNENGVLGIPQEITGLDNRYYLQMIHSAKYVSVNDNNLRDRYEEVNNEGVYYNPYTMPITRVYSKTVSASQYKQMTFAQKETVPTTHCVVPDENSAVELIDKPLLTANSEILDYTVERTSNYIKDNTIIIQDSNLPVLIDLNCPAGGSLYLGLYDFDCKDNQSKYNVLITAECDGIIKESTHLSQYDRYYFGKNDYLFNMEYSTTGRNQLALKFSQTGEYTFSDLQIEYLPYDRFLSTFEEQKSSAIENVRIGKNTIEASVDLDRTSIVYFSVPYSRGWKMIVDDEEKPCFRANIMGMGVMLDQGTHRIEMKYITPDLGIGIGFSIVGITGVMLVWFTHRNKDRYRQSAKRQTWLLGRK